MIHIIPLSLAEGCYERNYELGIMNYEFVSLFP